MTVLIPPVPTPVPQASDPLNFDARADAFVASLPAVVTAMNAQNVENNAINNSTNTNATAAQIAAAQVAAAMAANNPVANAAAASAAALQAQAYATLAQATNPDAPIRLNPRTITTTTVIPAGYNAASTGPLAVADGVSVTVSNFSTWSIT